MTIEQIWAQYRQSLKAFLHTKVANPEDVEDLLQDVLLKTHLAIKNLHKPTSIKAWLFQIAHNTVVDYYRKNGMNNNAQQEVSWYTEEERNVKKELAQCIKPFIQELPEQSAFLLEVIELEGKTQKQLANEMDVSYSTLKSQVQKARKELHNVFNSCCQYDIDKQGNLIEYHKKRTEDMSSSSRVENETTVLQKNKANCADCGRR
ncbi:RNA polymerase sigma factor SigZ [Pseudoalteromonas luteoviolacea]|uniref:RNA polymerase sigma factor SigZ n=1 Tax=Pseudoalteromonas luteoviolacea TaxID=43657 RepID=A0A1C0TQC0_9GAMM|nr:RNA polymerase sigma factor SigZ [Pseudoalteromonas luteoviolacea]OCQ21177.1 RNA polymerase sigma factor SigZ [Pseudoalteromonas luteoviolacea]